MALSRTTLKRGQGLVSVTKVHTAELLRVAGKAPLALLDHLLDGLADLGASSHDVLRGELVEGASLLDVAESRLEVLELTLELDRALLSLRNLFCVSNVRV